MFIVIRDKVVDLLEDYHGGTDIAGRIEVEQSPGFMG
jgi:hypothetical protein